MIAIALEKPARDRSCGVLDRKTVIEVLQRTCECSGLIVVPSLFDLIAVENFFHIRPPFARGAVG